MRASARPPPRTRAPPPPPPSGSTRHWSASCGRRPPLRGTSRRRPSRRSAACASRTPAQRAAATSSRAPATARRRGSLACRSRRAGRAVAWVRGRTSRPGSRPRRSAAARSDRLAARARRAEVWRAAAG
eukprot:4317063-Prymnesium_polylepis.1